MWFKSRWYTWIGYRVPNIVAEEYSLALSVLIWTPNWFDKGIWSETEWFRDSFKGKSMQGICHYPPVVGDRQGYEICRYLSSRSSLDTGAWYCVEEHNPGTLIHTWEYKTGLTGSGPNLNDFKLASEESPYGWFWYIIWVSRAHDTISSNMHRDPRQKGLHKTRQLSNFPCYLNTKLVWQVRIQVRIISQQPYQTLLNMVPR